MGLPKIRGTTFGGPNNKDYSILGSLLGSPYFGKLPYQFVPIVLAFDSSRFYGPHTLI